MTWTFEQSSGKLFNAAGELVATGYAGGNCGANPEGVNNPEMQAYRGIGPLPQGTYTTGVPYDSNKLGPFAIPLVPGAANDEFDRSGFFMHGDTKAMNHAASEGCIIMPRLAREQFYASKDLLKVVSYITPTGDQT